MVAVSCQSDEVDRRCFGGDYLLLAKNMCTASLEMSRRVLVGGYESRAW